MIPKTPRTCVHLGMWCEKYQFDGTVPQPGHVRFAIGVYQISQGMSWRIASPVKWQSYCSAAMHFMMCASAFDIDADNAMPETLEEVSNSFDGWEALMLALGKAQQQVVYSLHSSATSTRASRFNKAELERRLVKLITACLSLCPPKHREQCCFDEMHILCKDLPK